MKNVKEEKKETRTEKLSRELERIYEENRVEIEALSVIGPRGGSNARIIPGWKLSPNGTISRAIGLFGGRRADYYSGRGPTPSTAIPAVIYDEALEAYYRIFE